MFFREKFEIYSLKYKPENHHVIGSYCILDVKNEFTNECINQTYHCSSHEKYSRLTSKNNH